MIAACMLAVLPQSDGAKLERTALDEVVYPVLEAQHIPGVVVAVTRGDELLFLEPFGLRDVASGAPMRADDLFLVGSITKDFTATLLALLAAEGKLALDDPLAKHLDAAQPLPAWTKEVTLEQIATHTAGLPRNPVNRRDVEKSPSVMLPYSREELYASLAHTELEARPGERWSYSNLGYALLGEVVARASGKRYEELLRARILAPLGMTDSGITFTPEQEARLPSGYWPEDAEPVARPRWQMGEVSGFVGLFTTGRDLARFVVAQTASGPGAPFPSDVLRTLHAPRIDVPDSPGRRMALGWFVQSMPGLGALIGGGGEVDSFSAALAFLEEPRLGVVVLANRGGDSAEDVIQPVLFAVLPRFLQPGR